jgi:23S rRNA pseudouridine1911/1915/1917 synthase
MTSLLREFTAGPDAEGLRLDAFLAARLHELSRMRIAALIEAGAAHINQEASPAGRKLRAGDAVTVRLAAEPAPNSMTPEPLPLKIVYEDAHLVVVVKPAGMLMHPTRGVKTGTLANALAFHLNRDFLKEVIMPRAEALHAPEPMAGGGQFRRPGLVHRLDRATSGLVVVAKTQAALSRLSIHFNRRLVEKRYLALLHGRVAESELVIRAPIGRDAEAWPPWRVRADGKPAETRLRVLERLRAATLVELEPVTGRTNQLRIHCAHAGHPIAGDEWHAADGLPRLCLHAARLSFRHPATNDPISFISPLPSSIQALRASCL